MKKGFTLIELLVVITIIGILAGLTVSAGSAVMEKSKRSRAAVEIAALETALSRYKIDFGDYPNATLIVDDTDGYAYNTSAYIGEFAAINEANRSVTPVGTAGVRYLFAALMGRRYLTQTGQPIAYPQYIEVKASQVSADGSYFRDPYGNAYGYYYDATPLPKPDGKPGDKSVFNLVEPDIWSTAGQSADAAVGTEPTAKWIKNWSGQ